MADEGLASAVGKAAGQLVPVPSFGDWLGGCFEERGSGSLCDSSGPLASGFGAGLVSGFEAGGAGSVSGGSWLLGLEAISGLRMGMELRGCNDAAPVESAGRLAGLVIGGESVKDQLMTLQTHGIHSVIATPGRLKDILKRKAMKLDNCRFIALDEADRLLDLGFDEELGDIMNNFSHQRQNLLFSVSYPLGLWFNYCTLRF